jgi:sugar phosphate isomerase/epimerase
MSFWAGVPRAGVDHDAARAWLDEGLDRVLDHAEAIGIDASFEPEPGMLIETVGDYDALAARHPRLRLALDTGHCLVTQDIDPAVAIRAYAARIGTVAVEDMRRGDHTHLPFGQGDMDIPAVLAALTDIGFTRLVCVELSRESPRAHDAIPESIAYLKAAA